MAYLPITGSGIFETATQAVESVNDELPNEVILHGSGRMHLLLSAVGNFHASFFLRIMTLVSQPDTVFGENFVHLVKVRRAVHHYLLLQ